MASTPVTALQVARHQLDEADDQGQPHRDQEEVGWDREDAGALFDAAQVDQRHEYDHADGDFDAKCRQRWKHADDVGDACRDAHGDGQDVVGQQRSARDLGQFFAQVFFGDAIATAACRVGEDRLAVGNRHNRNQEGDGNGNRDRYTHSVKAKQRETADRRRIENDQQFLRRVGAGGKRVTGKHGERNKIRRGLMGYIGGAKASDRATLLQSVHGHHGQS